MQHDVVSGDGGGGVLGGRGYPAKAAKTRTKPLVC